MTGRPALAGLLLIVVAGCGEDPMGLDDLRLCGNFTPDSSAAASVWPGWDEVAVIAHRGFACCNPENTLEAIHASIAAGAQAVEVDVRLTRDGVPVLIHDGNLYRTTDAFGHIGTFRLADLQRINACPSGPVPCAIPTLQRALEAVRGRARLVIDVKDANTCARFEAIAAPVRALDMASEVAIISPNPNTLSIARSLFPDMPVGLTVTSLGLTPDRAAWPVDVARHLGKTELLVRLESVRSEDALYRAALERDVGLVPWTVWAPTEIPVLLARPGVRRVISDVPPP